MKPLAFLLLLAASPASAFIADNDQRVLPQGDGTILVPWNGSSAATDFWCAAGDYAKRELRAQGGDTIWRLTPVPRPQGQGIAFSFTAPASPMERSFLAGETGQMSVSMAESYCDQPEPGWIDLTD
jgi:hypothetical protein